MGVLYLTESEIESFLSMDLALDAVDAAFRSLGLDESQNVPRQRCQTDRVMLHVLQAAAKTLGVIGLKAYTATKQAARFHVTLYDARSGEMTAILEADALGQFRTGAASGVATRLLARPDSHTVGLYGTGKQARTQLLAICKVCPITKAHVYGRDAAKRASFVARLSAETGVDVIPVDRPEDAARGMDVICTATSAREPVLFGEWVAAGTHLNLAGSNFLAKAEADVAVFRKATLVTADSRDQAIAEAGDLVEPIRAGVLTWSDVRDLAPVLVGRYPGRRSAADVTVFKSLGLGVEDIALAARVVSLARERGVGRDIF